jgi:hypothetical protein
MTAEQGGQSMVRCVGSTAQTIMLKKKVQSSPEVSRVRWIARRTAAVTTGKDGMVKQNGIARPLAMTLVCGSY